MINLKSCMILHERSFFEANFKPLPAPPRPPSISGTSVRSSSYENVSLEWRQYVKSTLKQYVSASGQGVTHDSVECPQLEDGPNIRLVQILVYLPFASQTHPKI